MININKFAVRFKETRKEAGFTRKQLAQLINKSEATICRYENAKITPSKDTLAQLEKILKVNLAWLLGSDDVGKYETSIHTYNKNFIPILGYIAAGQPIFAHENIIGYEYCEDDCSFCLKVKGDSMIGARIFDGDIVFIKKEPDIENGQIAAVSIDNNEVTLKRIYKLRNALILHSENPLYQDLVFSEETLKLLKF